MFVYAILCKKEKGEFETITCAEEVNAILQMKLPRKLEIEVDSLFHSLLVH